MKNKLVGISIVMLLLALISSTSMAIETPEEETLLILKGTVKINEIVNNTVHAFGIRLFYLVIKETERTMGWGLLLSNVIFPDEFHIIPLFGNISLVFGIGQGEFEYEDSKMGFL